jgi:phosphoglycolate phosphatase-like HAD superfamily hydrolase
VLPGTGWAWPATRPRGPARSCGRWTSRRTLWRPRRTGGAAKPDPAFFEHLARAAPCRAQEILYVGDRLDNDIRPAAAVGMATALIRRGPWGVIQQDDPDADRLPTLRIDALTELAESVTGLNAERHSGTPSI